MSTALILGIALILDALLGEPHWLWSRFPHPAVVMGRAVGWVDRAFNAGGARRIKGVIAMLALGLGALALGFALTGLGHVVEILIVAILLAQRSLVDHVRQVADALRVSLGDARQAVARIVGRDTAQMDGPAIARGAIESAAENLSDGVIAPAFWYLIGGLPGLLLYKITNTADSMIGYQTEKYAQFGWAAARFDDVLNLVPARLTAALMALTHGVAHQWQAIAADARRHRSPNAGWPEAAMARALDVSLSGPRSYDGEMREFPYVHAQGRKDIGAKDIENACAALWRTWATAFVLTLALAVVFAL